MEGNENEIEVEVPEFEPLLPYEGIVQKKFAIYGAGVLSAFFLIFLCVESVLMHNAQDLTIGTGIEQLSLPIVHLSLGQLNGAELRSRAGKLYHAFYNVPYAQPPVGELRFQAPRPVNAWPGIRDAVVKGNMCVQLQQISNRSNSSTKPSYKSVGNEDCLYMNVFTSKVLGVRRRANLPVLVFLHDGNFMTGNINDFSAAYLMDEDVVAVLVQFRLGAFGFLNTGDSAATGNQGLKDQVMALQYIQSHIRQFGGDPSKVVVAGQGSGAMAAHSHLISAMSQDLISGAISWSGSALSPAMFNWNPRITTLKLAESVNCSNFESSVDIVNCLRTTSSETIAFYQSPKFLPSVEVIPTNANVSNVFFLDTPFNLLRDGKFSKLPWIAGVASTSNDYYASKFKTEQNVNTISDLDWEEMASQTLNMSWIPSQVLNPILQKIQKFYFRNNIHETLTFSGSGYRNMIFDRYYVHPVKVSAMFQSTRSPVYLYNLRNSISRRSTNITLNYEYNGSQNEFQCEEEMQYVLLKSECAKLAVNSTDVTFSRLPNRLWISFASTGVPAMPYPNEIQWPRASKPFKETKWLKLPNNLNFLEVQPFLEQMRLWDSIPLELLYL